MAGLACAAYLFGGLALSFRFFKGEGCAAWLLLGGVWATVFCAVLPALWAFLWGFTAQANLCAAGTALVLGAACLPWGHFGRARGLARFVRLSLIHIWAPGIPKSLRWRIALLALSA